MTTDLSVAATPEQMAIVRSILGAWLPGGAKVCVFGSRARRTASRYSDLDLLIDAGRRLTIDESASLREAFSESDLPWKVDFIDRHGTEAYFCV